MCDLFCSLNYQHASSLCQHYQTKDLGCSALDQRFMVRNSNRRLRDCTLPAPWSCTAILWSICSINSPAALQGQDKAGQDRTGQDSQAVLHQHPVAELGGCYERTVFCSSSDPRIFLFHIKFSAHLVQLVYKDRL